jgi:hypothetical protein
MRTARRVTAEAHVRGFCICGCGKFVHVFSASVLQKLPRDYHGELCPECKLWMCSVVRLREAGLLGPQKVDAHA